MIKFLIDMIQIAIMVNLIWIVLKWTIFRKVGKKGKSSKGIISKCVTLVSRSIHHKLDEMLKTQKESLAPLKQDSPQKEDISNPKVIPLTKARNN